MATAVEPGKILLALTAIFPSYRPGGYRTSPATSFVILLHLSAAAQFLNPNVLAATKMLQ